MKQAWTLVTGASGFIGSNLVRQLVAQGEYVKAFVRPGSDLRPLMGLPAERCQLAFGDILVEHTVFRALAGCTRLYHAATHFELWEPRSERIIRPAVDGTRAVLDAAKRRDLERVVVTSSTAVLGTTTSDEPMDEDHEFNLSDPEAYTRAKYEAEQVVAEFVKGGLPIVRVLPSTVIGPGDVKPTPNGRTIIQYLKAPPGFRVPVFEGGLNIADVDDAVRGHILAMQKGTVGERYILGGDNLSFFEIFESLSEITGLAEPGQPKSKGLAELVGRLWELKARLFGGRPVLTRRLARDYVGAYVFVTSAKAERELGYTHRSAREAQARAVRWFLEKGYVPEKAASRVRLELRPV
jgi:dihydroflavonol-4-reductase